MKPKKIPFNEFKEVYSKVPRLTVEILVQTDEGFVFTLREIEPYKGQWHIPGGTVLFKETLEEAVKRVAIEELGVQVEVEKLVGYIEYPNEEKEGGFGWPIGAAFLTKIISGKLKGGEQGSKIQISKKIPEKLIEDQKTFLRKYKLID